MIVGIGELLWDVFPDGRKVAGGAPFNFAFHCQQLGYEAVIVSRVGADDLGRELRDEAKRLGLSDEFIQTERDHPTGTVQVSVDATGQPTYTITENVAWDFIEWDDNAERLAETCHCVCFGTLAQRHPVSRFTIRQFIGLGADLSSTLCVFDVNLRPPFLPPAQLLRECCELSDLVKVNGDEWGDLADLYDMPSTDLPFWLRRHGGKPGTIWIVTEGGDGVWVDPPQPILGGGFKGIDARVIDTVGAGDAFTAAMVCLHLEGRPLRECAQFANHYAARVCEHQGGTPRIDRAEVELAAFG